MHKVFRGGKIIVEGEGEVCVSRNLWQPRGGNHLSVCERLAGRPFSRDSPNFLISALHFFNSVVVWVGAVGPLLYNV